MRYLFFLFFLGLILSPNYGQAQIRKDHMLHFGAGMVAGGAGAFVASELSGGQRGWTFAGAVGASLLAGIAKEALDKNNGKQWDNSDIGATVLGGVTIGVTIDLFTARARKRRNRVQVPTQMNTSSGYDVELWR